MSVVGFDFGNENCLVAVARQKVIDVVLNDESNRETPAIVCFGDKQRFIGTAGAASTMMHPKNSISQIKRLIGRQFSDPELQRDIKSLPFSVTEGPDGYPLIHASYMREISAFTPTQVMGMMLSNLKGIAEKNLNAAVFDCCIGIPVYFTDLQRRAVLDAATIAGLHPLHLIHETTATALAYGFYKTDLPENDQLNVAFVDIGHASMQVCIAGFKKGQLQILSHGFDRSLGGRDFDEVLFNHFAAKFKDEYKIDVSHNAKACLMLRAACEKLKKVLTANPLAPLNIECLLDEKDVRCVIMREEFEEISIPILERVKRPLEKALSDAGLTVEDVHMVEVVGSGSRVPAMIKILTDFFGKEPRRTMNASESVSRGCALQCAILSPTIKVREFQVHESFPFSISLAWKGASSDAQNGGAENQQSTIVFPNGNPIPSVKALTLYCSGTFSIDVQYSDVNDLQAPPKISTYTIGPFRSSKGERAKLKVEVRLNLHGIVSVESATAEAPKKKVRKTNVPLSELVYGALKSVEVDKAVEKEFEMALQDRVMEETKDRKNALESYVYDMRNKLSDIYQEYITESEREAFLAKLQEVEIWLYEDGEDETKGVYVAKLEELKKVMHAYDDTLLCRKKSSNEEPQDGNDNVSKKRKGSEPQNSKKRRKKEQEEMTSPFKEITSLLTRVKEILVTTADPETEKESGAGSSFDAYSKYIGPKESEEDSDIEAFLLPNQVCLANMLPGTKRSDVKNFFRDTGSVTSVKLFRHGNKVNKRAMTAYVDFKSLSVTKQAIKMNGEVMKVEGKSELRNIWVTRSMRSLKILFVSGYSTGLTEDERRELLLAILTQYGKRIKVFLPKDEDFAYVIIYNINRISLERVIAKGYIRSKGSKIIVREVSLRGKFLKEKANWVKVKPE